MATNRASAAAFLLHSTPYRETSLVVDLFTRDYGRIAAVAKGAKRPRSTLRAVLLQFQPLIATWSGRQELRTLIGAEWTGGLPAPQGDETVPLQAVLCGPADRPCVALAAIPAAKLQAVGDALKVAGAKAKLLRANAPAC